MPPYAFAYAAAMPLDAAITIRRAAAFATLPLRQFIIADTCHYFFASVAAITMLPLRCLMPLR